VAFEADALAYLLKPVAAERLAQAVDRAFKLSDKHRERERVMRVASARIQSRMERNPLCVTLIQVPRLRGRPVTLVDASENVDQCFGKNPVTRRCELLD
jgi:DNA-binding LytR/AlgR family response regulator